MYSNHRLVILDADGTTVDAFGAIQQAFASEGMDLGDLGRFQQRRNLFKYLGGVKEFPTNLKQQIGKKKRQRLIGTLTEVYRSEAKMFEGMPALIDRMMALPDLKAVIFAIRQMNQKGYQGQIVASVHYEDEISILKEEGIDAAYSLYEEAGVGFADHVCAQTDYCKLRNSGLKSATAKLRSGHGCRL